MMQPGDIAYLAFTAKGQALAERLAAALGGQVARCGGAVSLAGWVAAQFPKAGGLVFVGAAGIAVRAIAPHLHHKASDPAVVVVDECGRFAIPILSGHLGGGNALARQIAACCGAQAVITTATDANGVFAVDEWAKRQGCRVQNPGRIKAVSAVLLAGGQVGVYSRWPVAGTPPQGVRLTLGENGENSENSAIVESSPSGKSGEAPPVFGVWLDVQPPKKTEGDPLFLVPPVAVLGVGCKKGTTCGALEGALAALLAGCGLAKAAICQVATIDLKQGEPGLLEFCRANAWPLAAYPAAELRRVQGSVTPSAFVAGVTGVDNVCERSALAAAKGTLYQTKQAGNGVTMAVALKPYAPDWSWQDE
ncbi:MAG: cobalamin biosynthesis protein [Gemmiger sp.]|nr:cobalamin biosynthesis protein [Gemmiger sp.]